MRQVRASLGIALLVASELIVHSAPSLAATDPGPAQTIPPAINTRNSAVYLPPAPAAEPPKPAAAEPAATAPGAAKAGPATKPPTDPSDGEVTKLKYQIKTTRLSLADTQGRLSVTDKDLASASTENVQLRSDTTNLRVGLAKAETVAKKSEDELGQRRQEVQALQVARHSGWGMVVVVLLLSLLTVGMVAVVLVRHGSRLRAIQERLQDTKVDDGRIEQLRVELEQERARAQRLEEESQRARTAVAASQTEAPAGSKREKLEHVRRELRQAQAAVEAEKRRAEERIQRMEAEMARLSAERQAVDERIQKLEPAMAELANTKQDLSEQVQKLAPEVERLSSEKQEAEARSRLLAHDVARVTAEKLRLEHALAKANEKLAFFGQDEPEDTLPPIVG